MNLNNEGFGDNWDLGDYISEDLICIPIKHFLHSELRKQGINPQYWRRRGAALTAGAVGGFIGSILGGPMGLLLGLIGYTSAMSASYPDEDEETVQEQLEQAMLLTAASIATEALKHHVSRETWNAICDEAQDTINQYRSTNPSPEATVDLFYDAISRVDSHVADQWLRVFQVSKREVGM